MSEDEKTARKDEALRRTIAAVLSLIAAVLCLVFLVEIRWHHGPRPAAFIETLLASAMAATIVLAARAIDGPIALRSRRRSDAASVGAAGIIVMWLGCFATLEGAFVAIDVIGKAGALIVADADRKDGSEANVDYKKTCGAHRATTANDLDKKNTKKPYSKTQKSTDGLSKSADCASGQNVEADDAADIQ